MALVQKDVNEKRNTIPQKSFARMLSILTLSEVLAKKKEKVIPEVDRPRHQPGRRRKEPQYCQHDTSCCRYLPPGTCRGNIHTQWINLFQKDQIKTTELPLVPSLTDCKMYEHH